MEFEAILAIDSKIDLEISGFEMGEIDVAVSAGSDDEEDPLPAPNDLGAPVAKPW
jgi:hypothetical protein